MSPVTGLNAEFAAMVTVGVVTARAGRPLAATPPGEDDDGYPAPESCHPCHDLPAPGCLPLPAQGAATNYHSRGKRNMCGPPDEAEDSPSGRGAAQFSCRTVSVPVSVAGPSLRLSLLSIGTVTVRLRTEARYWRAPVLHTITASLRTGGPLG